MKRLIFPIARTSSYRTLGPIIEAALGDRRWEVELILGPPMAPGEWKAYQNANPGNVPARIRGQCESICVEDVDELVGRLGKADVVISNLGRSFLTGDDTENVEEPLWCAVFDASHSADPSNRFGHAAMAFWPTSRYVEEAILGGVATREHLERTAQVVGYVRADALKVTTRDGTRREWGLDLVRPVVLYIPDGYRFWQAPTHVTDWYREVWCVSRRWERLLRAAVHGRGWRAMREAVREASGHDVVLGALRRFCERAGAQLVLALRRQKHWRGWQAFTRQELAVGDHVIREDEQYPQTLLRAIQAADLVVCAYRSGAVLEALAAGVPYVTIGVPLRAYTAQVQKFVAWFDRGVGHQPGATWVIGADEFVAGFADRTLADFTVAQDVLGRVRAAYVGTVDGSSSVRVLAAIGGRLKGGRWR